MNNRLLLTSILSLSLLALTACGGPESNAPTSAPTIDWAAIGNGQQDFAAQPIDPNAQPGAVNPAVSTPLIDPATGMPLPVNNPNNAPVAVAPSQAPVSTDPV